MPISEKRFQLYLPNDQFLRVKRTAEKKHWSFAQLVRVALDEFLKRTDARWEDDPITQRIGMLEGKETDLAKRHDDYIYGP